VLEGGGWSKPRAGRFTPGTKPDIHLTGGWAGLRAGVDGSGKFRPLRDSVPELSRSLQVCVQATQYGIYSASKTIWTTWRKGKLLVAQPRSLCTHCNIRFNLSRPRVQFNIFRLLNAFISLNKLIFEVQKTQGKRTMKKNPFLSIPCSLGEWMLLVCFIAKLWQQSHLLSFITNIREFRGVYSSCLPLLI
jgi:hypothetical protein